MKLLPAKNYRPTNHKCCAVCKYWIFIVDNSPPVWVVDPALLGMWGCERENGPTGEWSGTEPEWHVCDGFAWEKNG